MTPRCKRALRLIERALRERRPPDSDLACGCGAALDRPKVGHPPVRCSDCREEYRREYQREWKRKKRRAEKEKR